MTNHESIKIMLGFTLTLTTGLLFYKCKDYISSTFGDANYYLALSYFSVIPPAILNKVYDLTTKHMYEKKQRELVNDIDEDTLSGEGEDLKLLVKNKKDNKKEKLLKFKEIEASKKTL